MATKNILQIRRGSNLSNAGTPAAGELIYKSDTNELYIGDGSTAASSLTAIGGAGTSGSNNQLLTDDGSGGINSESKLTFNNSFLELTDAQLRLDNSTFGTYNWEFQQDSGGDLLFKVPSTGGAEVRVVADGSSWKTTEVHIAGEILMHADGTSYFKQGATPLVLGGTSAYTTGGTPRLSIQGAGLNIGSGTNDMSYMRRIATGEYQWQTWNGANDGELHLQPYGGKVGIGSAAPEALLHVQAADTVTGVLKIEGGKNVVTSSGEINARLEFGSNDTSVNNTGNVGASIATHTSTSNGAWNDLVFSTFKQSDPGLREVMRLDYLGRLGIGTSSPETPLHVNQDSNDHAFKVTGGGGGASIARFVRDIGLSSPYAEVNIHAGGGDPQISFRDVGNKSFSIGIDDSANSFKISDNTSVGTNDRFTISSAGDATFSGAVKLQSELDFTGNGNKNIDVETLEGSNYLQIRHHNPVGNAFENAIRFNANGGALIYYNGSNKLETTNTGVSVTGALSVSGALSFGSLSGSISTSGNINTQGSYQMDGTTIINSSKIPINIANGSGTDLTGSVLVTDFAGVQSPAVTGWYTIASGAHTAARGGGIIRISFTGGNATPATFTCDFQVDWSGNLLRCNVSNQTNNITKVRLIRTSSTTELQAYFVISSGLSSNPQNMHVTFTRDKYNPYWGIEDPLTQESSPTHTGEEINGTSPTGRGVKFYSAATDAFEINNSFVTINELGKDIDFRVESSSDANLLFTDGGNNRVGIGKNNPAYKFDVTGDINLTGNLRKNGLTMMSIDGSYTTILKPNAVPGIYLGQSDASNYYDNTRHRFRPSSGGSNYYANLGATGLSLSRLADAEAKLHIGDGGNSNNAMGTNILGTTAGDSIANVKLETSSTNANQLIFSTERISNGSDWTTTRDRIRRKIDATDMGYIQFGSSFGSNDMVGIGRTGVGTGFIVDGNLKVGIGITSSLAAKLHVVDSDGSNLARFKDSDSSYAGIIIAADTNGGHVGNSGGYAGEGIYFQDSLEVMRFYAAGSEQMRLTGTGRLGIGTTSPSTDLHINTTDDGSVTFTRDGTHKYSIEHDTSQMYLYNRTLNKNQIMFSHSGPVTINNDGHSTIDFRVEGDSDQNLFFTDASADKVSIGHNAPLEKLDVNGVAKFRGTSSSSKVLELGQLSYDANVEAINISYFDDTSGGSSLLTSGDHLEIHGGRWGSRTTITRGGQGGNVPIASLYGASSNAWLELYEPTSPTNSQAYATRIRLRADGDSYFTNELGIGTTSPTNLLHIEGADGNGVSLRIDGDASNGGTIRYGRATSYYWNAGVGGASSSLSNIPASFWGIEDQSQSNAVRFCIAHTTGNVGIGTNSPATKLHLMSGDLFLTANSTSANSGQGIYWQSTTSGWNTGQALGAIFGKRVDASNGYLRFDTRSSGTTAERMRLINTGALHVTNDVVAFSSTPSDQKLKTNVKDIEYGLDTIMKLKPKQYNWKKDDRHDIGFIAQEVEEVIPEIVKDNEWFDDKIKTMDYEKLTAVLIKAVQEQQQQINKLEEKLNG